MESQEKVDAAPSELRCYAAQDEWLQIQREKTARQDAKFSAFDQHQATCLRCQKAYEFWCDEGYALIRQ